MCAAPRLTPLRGTSLWLLSISLRFDSYIPMIKGHTYLIAIMDYLLTQVWGLASLAIWHFLPASGIPARCSHGMCPTPWIRLSACERFIVRSRSQGELLRS